MDDEDAKKKDEKMIRRKDKERGRERNFACKFIRDEGGKKRDKKVANLFDYEQ